MNISFKEKIEEFDKKTIDKLNRDGLQSIRHLEHNGVMYAIFIKKGFRTMGWMTNIKGSYYGLNCILKLKQKDDIIDYYITLDKNARDTIDVLILK